MNTFSADSLERDRTNNVAERFRDQINTVLIMRQRPLRNGIVVNYSFEHFCDRPHFQFYSHELSETGYFSDFFGDYESRLTDKEVFEAFDIRANMRYEEHQKEKVQLAKRAIREKRRKEKLEKEKCASQIVQLAFDF